jgi:hypothetical protein
MATVHKNSTTSLESNLTMYVRSLNKTKCIHSVFWQDEIFRDLVQNNKHGYPSYFYIAKILKKKKNKKTSALQTRK